MVKGVKIEFIPSQISRQSDLLPILLWLSQGCLIKRSEWGSENDHFQFKNDRSASQWHSWWWCVGVITRTWFKEQLTFGQCCLTFLLGSFAGLFSFVRTLSVKSITYFWLQSINFSQLCPCKDIVEIQNSLLSYLFLKGKLPKSFDNFFEDIVTFTPIQRDSAYLNVYT